MVNEGLLQLVLTTLLFKKTYPEIKMSKPLLVHATGQQVNIHDVTKEFFIRAPRLNEFIKSHSTVTYSSL
jgi:hypothetical protein